MTPRVIPNSIGVLTQLHSLSLTGWLLASLPAALSSLTNLMVQPYPPIVQYHSPDRAYVFFVVTRKTLLIMQLSANLHVQTISFQQPYLKHTIWQKDFTCNVSSELALPKNYDQLICLYYFSAFCGLKVNSLSRECWAPARQTPATAAVFSIEFAVDSHSGELGLQTDSSTSYRPGPASTIVYIARFDSACDSYHQRTNAPVVAHQSSEIELGPPSMD